MAVNIQYRQATEKDIPFLIDTIIAAEKSGTDRLSYATLFDISEQEVMVILAQILEEDMAGQELCVSGFIIAEVNGQFVGACNAWIEGEVGKSALIKSSLLMFYFGKERCLHAATYNEKLDQIRLHRTAGSLQIESVYVIEQFQGKGIGGALIEKQIRHHIQLGKQFSNIQIIVACNNDKAVRAYQKIGFAIKEEKNVRDSDLEKLLPSAHMCLLERKI